MHMNEAAHVIEIDRLVLTGVSERGVGRMRSPIEAEVARTLSGVDLPESAAVPNLGTRIAAEVARSVVHAVRGSER
jgi:hypothetical protein